MPYSYLTYSSARSLLAERLGDTSSAFWLNSGTYNELGEYLIEAMRTWNALTGYWRGIDGLNAQNGTAFYDLTQTLTGKSRSYNVTDTELVAVMQYHLVENAGISAPGSSCVGTDMFTLSDLTAALQHRRDEFLEGSGQVLTYSTQACSPPQPTYGFSSDSVIDVRRMAFQVNGSSSWSTLWRDDEQELAAYNPGWASESGTPQVYSVAASPYLTFTLSPYPQASGRVEMLTVNAGSSLNPASGVLLGIPDDWTWVVKWGALLSLLSQQGPAFDPLRAQYAKQRWDQGIELARHAPCVLAAKVQGTDRLPSTLDDFDAYNPGWENVSGAPADIGLAGLNMVALSPVPNSGSFGASFNLVKNAPIPGIDSSYVQVGREELEAVLDYAVHLAAFKQGGDEFAATFPLYKNFLDHAAVYADRLEAFAPSSRVMSSLMRQQAKAYERRSTDSKQEVTA